MSLQVMKSGFLSLVQDYGRYGYQSIGVTNGGPLDEHAFLWANRLLGNHYNAPQIEVSYGAFSATFLENTMMAICGADLSATVNDQAIKPWQSYAVYAGDTISFKAPAYYGKSDGKGDGKGRGLRCYLAVKGGFTVEPQLDSCSTVVREKLGGITQDGEKLAAGDSVKYLPQAHELATGVPSTFVTAYPKKITLRFIPNSSATSAGEEALHTFTKHTYQVTPNIDRMGYRLSGEVIHTPLEGIISQGISLGSIQVPKDGQPIVLMRDRQTMGGYPLLGCVASLDLSKLSQSLPGTELSFTPISVEAAEAELIEHKRFFRVAH
ncbi:MAG: biotin-dependent carboxylase-like uncharacterized protein [Candidatus Endobugula sp.]|jgi:biotin-dependent carboxylase-like uncharacterized protein